MIGQASLVKMILMPQLLYFLHSSPVVFPLKTFRTVNSLYCPLLWKQSSPRIRLEQLQLPKAAEGIAFTHPWLYYMAAQLQHMIIGMSPPARKSFSTPPSGKLITRVKQVIDGGHLLPFSNLQTKFGLPHQMYFYYLQLRHAVTAQYFPSDLFFNTLFQDNTQ